jgi:competence ComEA-like helix-hairpin-helix protein
VSTAVLAKELSPLHLIDLNHATLAELDQFPETGAKLVAAILRFRDKSGPFQRIEDLQAVPEITSRRLETMRSYVRIEAPRKAGTTTLPETLGNVGCPKRITA